MKILYETSINTKHYFNLDIIQYLKAIIKSSYKSSRYWNKINVSLVSDDKKIIWTKRLSEITEQDLRCTS